MKRHPLFAFAAAATALPLVSGACAQKAADPRAPTTAGASTSTSVASSPTTKSATPHFDRVPRAAFNRLAAELAAPLFWIADKNGNNALDPDELAVYWGLETGATPGDYVTKAGFSAKMLETYERIAKRHADPAPAGDPRRAAIRKELAQGRVTLLATDLTSAPPEEKKFVGHVVKAAELVERLYARQQGTLELAKKLPADDPASRTVYYRNQGPKCEAPMTQNDPSCAALPLADMPKTKLSGLYPQDLLADPALCDRIAKNKDKPIGHEFSVVVKNDKGELEGKPYTEAFKADMQAVAAELKSAAEALGDKEPALKAYVLAAARAFETNDWWPADEAWAKMDAKSSKYYLRIAPDEVYDEPCSVKALFHVSFGLINQGSLAWQSKLDPLKGEMERTLAKLAGAPYKARGVQFKLPDFVDIALNAGDSRKPFGGTIGQSLPNFGPVAKKGGRTVAMTNLYGDPDSIASMKEQAESLFCKDTMALYTTSPEPQLMSTVLHEAAHNLGPSHEYQVNGKVDRAVFGGPLASTLEELKAQTSALYFTDWLVDKKQISREEADRAHVRDIFWAFGHISRGMYTEDKKPKSYSQLAAIQLGALMQAGAVAWRPDEPAANGKDKGCFVVATDKMPAAIKTLMTEVAQIKGRGDKPRAEALVKAHVDVAGDKKKMHDVITERMLRAPKATFVYAIKLD